MNIEQRWEFVKQVWKENHLEKHVKDFMDTNVIWAIIYDEPLPPATLSLVDYQARKRLGLLTEEQKQDDAT